MKRNGSALLIVLGVLSFLVVSAVTFSAFMRRARQPSSYLRRTVASRQLAKAALSHAIDEIDHAIAYDVHPNIGDSSVRTWSDGTTGRHARNIWYNRVFMRENTTVNVLDTAPTLTLEGLAYIPPSLVNDVRRWARRTQTAKWQPIPYDIGRYAYLAIDVSDYFDVNRLVAGYPRSSSSSGRITMAHLFEKGGNGNGGGWDHPDPPSGADDWDDFMDDYREFNDNPFSITFKSHIPLISLADFNLALYEKGGIGDFVSPFGKFLESDTRGFYDDGDSETFRQMTFVTDGWFPSSATNTVLDLESPNNQPFRMQDLTKSSNKSLESVLTGEGVNSFDFWAGRLSAVGLAALWDYLDEDSVPLSLAAPTTERVPMVCGMSPSLPNMNFKITKSEDELKEVGTAGDTTRTVKQTVKWKIDGGAIADALDMGHVQALVSYPFLHKNSDEQSPTFTVDGRITFFFSSPDITLRPGQNSVLRVDDKGDFKSEIVSDKGLFHVKLGTASPKPTTMTAGSKPAKVEDAIFDCANAMNMQNGSGVAKQFSSDDTKSFLEVTYSWKQTRTDAESEDWKPTLQDIMSKPISDTPGATVEKAECHFPALDKNGQVDNEFTAGLMDKVKQGPGWKKTICLYAAIWLRIKNGDKVVDMVPACLADDAKQLDKAAGDVQEFGGPFAGIPYPIMKFGTGVEVNFGVSMECEALVSVTPKAAMIADPRFNYAPEHWFLYNDEMTETKWKDEWKKSSDEDDVFLSTSDAGYLQSVYELAFLPALTDLLSNGATVEAGNMKMPGGLITYNERGKEQNCDYMCRNYDPFGDNAAAFEELHAKYQSGVSGMKVNPYSDSTNVLMAAFANTPIDWRCASTNTAFDFCKKIRPDSVNVATFNRKYAWNSYNDSAKLFWYDLEEAAGNFIDLTHQQENRDSWLKAWRKLDWYADDSNPYRFLNVDMDKSGTRLWSADRKFLYGFWRDCFEAKQQLFLIFVRAEPLLLGGGSADQLPPQLGARAVALVWRDPNSPPEGIVESGVRGYPHRTRLLFYKPLD